MVRGLRPRHAAPLALAAVLLAGCNVPSNAPEGYGDQVRADFVQGCTGQVPETDGTTTTLASTSACECAYEVFEQNVPYDDDAKDDMAGYDGPTFREIDDKAADRPEAYLDLPADVRGQIEACGQPGGGQGSSDEGDDEQQDPPVLGEPSDTAG